MDFIGAHASTQLKVDDVARHLGASRRLLEAHFKNILGKTIHDAIAAQRISHAQKLINGTSRSFSKIARELGFSSLSNFSHWMRRQTGTSLHELRANPSNTSNNCAGVASDEGNPSP